MPTANRLDALASASPDDEPSPELHAAIDSPIGLVMNVLDGLVCVAVIFVMVAKSFN